MHLRHRTKTNKTLNNAENKNKKRGATRNPPNKKNGVEPMHYLENEVQLYNTCFTQYASTD
jgi:hypothetical protein